MKRYFSLILAIAATVSAQIVPSTGNVRGPTSATDNAVARYDGTTGKLIQNSGVSIDDSGNLTVSGGTIDTAASTNLNLAGGSSGGQLSLIEGANGGAYVFTKGSGVVNFVGNNSVGYDGLRVINSSQAANTTKSVGVGFFGTDTVGTTKAAGYIYSTPTGQDYVSANLSFFTRASDAVSETMRLFSNGNLFIGASPVDGGQKLQVSGTAYVSGNTTFGGNLTATAANKTLTIDNITNYGQNLVVNAAGSLSLILQNNGAATLTLDSSQNATFAGNGQIGANYTVAQKKLEIIGGSYADGQTLRLADYSTAYGFDIVNDGINAKLKVVRHSNSVGGTEAISVSRDAALTTFEGAIAVADGMTAPSATSGVAKIYVDTADGDLKVIFGDGTVKTIVTD